MAKIDQDTSYGVEHEYRMALIGKTGSGKSATGNKILGKKAFKSKMSGSSVTKKCEFHTAERFGKKLVVVDTPGLFDTSLSNDVITKEIVKCVGILTPGPHAFILVVQIGRITPEEQDTVTHFARIFGEEFFRYLIVLFTRRDDLERNGENIKEYVDGVPDELKYILQRCGYKYLAFDNFSSGETDVRELVLMVQSIINKSGKAYFSNNMFEKSELEFQRRAREIRLKGEEKIALIQEELEVQKRKLEEQKRELEAKRLEIQTKELENLALEKKDHAETIRKQEAMKTEMEAKRKEMEEKEIENAKFELRKKLELEEMERKYREETKNMRDNVRKEYESEDKNVFGKLLDAAKSTVSTVGSTLFGWLF